MKKYDVVIFDWDGTLMDSVDKIVHCMQACAEELGMREPSADSVKQIIGLALPEAVKVLYPEHNNKDVARVVAGYREQYEVKNSTPTPLFQGVDSVLIQLKQSGIKLAVATGMARVALDQLLLETGLISFFDITRCADEAKGKPHPLMLQQIITALNVEPERAVMVGDSTFDLDMANNAGIDSIGVTYGTQNEFQLRSATPKAIVSCPLDILEQL